MPVYKYKNTHGQFLWYVKFNFKGKSICKRGFKLKQDAKNYEHELILEYKTNDDLFFTYTFNDVLVRYLNYYKSSFKASSYDNKLRRIKFHLHGTFPMYFTNITYNDFFQFLSEIKATVSVSMANRLLSDLRSINKYAKVFLKISNDNIDKIPLFKDYHLVKKTSIFNVLTFDHFNLFINSITEEDFSYKVFFILAFYTGLRFGELCGLTLNSLDFEHKLIHVNQQLVYNVINHSYDITTPKTETSVRDVPISDSLINLLKVYIKTNRIGKRGFLFGKTNSSGHFIKTTVQNKIRKYCAIANIPIFKFHSIRKGYATFLLSKGVPPNVVSKYLGHTNFNTTSKYYVGLLQEQEEQVRKVVDFSKKII